MSNNKAGLDDHSIEIQPTFEILTEFLKMKRKIREETHVDSIAKNIYNLSYFQSLISEKEERLEFVKECSKHLKHKFYPKGSEVFRKGDKGQNFYIILRGVATVFIPKDIEEIERDACDEEKKKAVKYYTEFIRKTNKKESRNGDRSSQNKNVASGEVAKRILSEDDCSDFQGKISQDLSLEEKLLLLNDTSSETPYYIKGTSVFKKIVSLREGECFGELALIFNQPRTASIIASEDLHLLVLKNYSYKAVFASEIRNAMNKMKFFQNIFPDFPTVDILRFCHLLQEQGFKFNDVIAREGEASEAIYFLKEGEVQLSKSSRPGASDSKRNLFKQSFPQRRIIAASLQPGQFFGDCETTTDGKVNYRATCTSTTRVYVLKKHPTLKILERHFPKMIQKLKELEKKNQEARKERVRSNEKLQFSKLNLEDQIENTERYASDAKVAEEKIKYIHRRTSESISLHQKSKYDSRALSQEEERDDDLKLSSARRKTSINVPNIRSSFSQRISISIPDSYRDSIPDLPSSSTIKTKDSISNLQLNTPQGVGRKIRLSITVSEQENSPRTPTSSNSTPRVVLPQININKSTFSGLCKDAAFEGGFASIARKLKRNSDCVQNNYVNVLNSCESPRVEPDISERILIITKRQSLGGQIQKGDLKQEEAKIDLKVSAVQKKLKNMFDIKSPRSVEQSPMHKAKGHVKNIPKKTKQPLPGQLF